MDMRARARKAPARTSIVPVHHRLYSKKQTIIKKKIEPEPERSEPEPEPLRARAREKS